MKHYTYLFILSLIFFACKSEAPKNVEPRKDPVISENGTVITFPDSGTSSFFQTVEVSRDDLSAEFEAPATIAATVVASRGGAGRSLLLFENAELSSHYTQFIQHQTNISQLRNVTIKQKELELSRTKDLQEHGAATGQDLLNVQTELSIERSTLANEQAALIEHEAKLIAAGFSPDVLTKSRMGTSYLICDVPESQINDIRAGSNCTVVFKSFPGEKFTGRVDAVTDIVDAASRMVKVRVSLRNTPGKLKLGMFAKVSFPLSGENLVSVPREALVIVQGKHFVFVRKSDRAFERREVGIGQQIGEKVVILSGLNAGEEVAIEGAMQLKGLSFGY